MYELYRTQYLERQRQKMDMDERVRLDAIEERLAVNPQGRMLGLPFFREKRLNGKRLLFLVYEHENALLLVLVTDKKHQQQDIDKIKAKLSSYRDLFRFT